MDVKMELRHYYIVVIFKEVVIHNKYHFSYSK